MSNNTAIIQATSHKPQATSHKPPIILSSQQTNHYEDFERERLDPIYDIVAPYSEMMKNERYFLNGIIRSLRPHKILEVGVSSGGGTAMILNAISDIDGAKLYSVDYMEKAYRHPDKPSGFLVYEQFPHLMDKWQIFRGGDISRFIEKVGGDIDLLVLDTGHVHPCETLNFLCVLPFMKNNSWTVLHDISLFAVSKSHRGLACRYLFSHVGSDEKIYPPSDYEHSPANIGAFRVSEAAMKYVQNLFESLFIPWEYEVKPEDLESISAIINKYYSPEQSKLLHEAVEFQKYLKEQDDYEKYSFFVSMKLFLKSWRPDLFKKLRQIKRRFRKK